MVEPELAALYAFDGKRVAGLRSLVRSAIPDAAFLAEMPGDHEIGASWILKARAETGALGEESGREMYFHLSELTEPDAILHVLQSVQYAPFAASEMIRPFLTHKRTLLRVWALDALARVAPHDAAALVHDAMDDPSAAMRARARALQAVVS